MWERHFPGKGVLITAFTGPPALMQSGASFIFFGLGGYWSNILSECFNASVCASVQTV